MPNCLSSMSSMPLSHPSPPHDLSGSLGGASPSLKRLKTLYRDLQDTLAHTNKSMQDTALSIVVEIKNTIKEVLSGQDGNKYPINPRRLRRYGPHPTTDSSSSDDQDLSPQDVFYHQLASEAQVMKQAVGRGLSTQHLLSQITRTRSRIRIALQGRSPLEIIQEFGILHHIHEDGENKPFVPTMPSDGIQAGSGRGYEKIGETAQKFQAVLQFLLGIDTPEGGHIDPRDLIVDLQVGTPDSMMREIPYIVIRIPRLNRTILINDTLGEATFVLMGLTDLGDIRSYHKRELQTILSAQRIEYNDTYETRLRSYLLSDWELYSPDDPKDNNYLKDNSHNIKESHDSIEHPVTHSNTIKPRTKLNNHLLFLDRDTIQRDLTIFLQEAKIKNSLVDLLTNNPPQNTKVILSNGQEVTWNTYLIQASGILLGTKQASDNPHRVAEALTRLCEIVGVERAERVQLDTDYVSEANKETLQQDLIKFLQQAKIKNSLADLLTSNPSQNTKVILSNGQEINWNTYLRRASSILFGTKGGSHRQAEALTLLLKRIGVPILDNDYFSEANKEGIRKDLMNFLQKAKNKNPLADLSTRNPPASTKVTLSNGQEMVWQTYLNQASGVLLGTKQASDNPPRPAEALTLLLKRIGVPILDNDYFSEANKASIEQDFTNFLQKAKNKNSLADLSTSNPPASTKVVLSNGQEIIWSTYLNQASGVLLGTKGGSHRQAEALTRLCEIMGVERKVG